MKKTLLIVAFLATSLLNLLYSQTSLDFDGIDDYVDLGSDFSLVDLVDYTKEFWVKWDGVSTSNNVLSGDETNNHAFWFPDSKSYKMSAGHGNTFDDIQDPNPVTPNVWIHYALTYDPDTGDMIMYRDGVQVALYDGPPEATFATSTILVGAYRNFGTTFNFGGQIDNVRIWDFVRSQTEIQNDMNSCLTGSEPGLVAYYDFEDGTGSTILSDGTSNGYDGTLTNMDASTDWITGQGFCGDIIPPDVTISSSATSPTNVSPIPVTITFSESVNGFDVTDLVLENGSASDFAGSGSEYTVNITPATDGPVTVDIAADAGVDTAGNGNTAAEQFSIDYDITSPTVMISSILESPTNVSPIPVTITFSESVNGFDVTDLVLENGSASDFAGSGLEYTVNITPATDGPVTVDIAADAGVDTAGNGNTAAEQLSIDYDGTSPTVAISSTLEGPTNVSPIPVTITFSESVNGFDVTDLVLENGSASDFAGSGSEYTVNITPATDGPVTVDIAADAGVDTAGNGNTAAEQLSIDYDGTSPTVAISSTLEGPTNVSPIPVTITFSESVTGFDVTDLVLENGSASDFAGSGSEYTVNITPATDGPVTVDIAADAGVDTAGNGNTAAEQFSIDYDITSPTVAISSTLEGPTNVSPIPVTITFSESVTGFDVTDLVLENGSASDFAGSGSEYTVNITPATDGPVTVDIAADAGVDTAGNGNTAAEQFSIDYDITSPTVMISSILESPTDVSPIPVTITFSESVTGFDVTDLVLGNGTGSGFAGSGSEYTVNITPITGGEVTVDIAADAGVDTAGNGNTAAEQFSIDYDTISPTVAISSTLEGPTNVSPIPVTITFSESVTGFDVTDLVLENGSASDFAGSGSEYTVNITPATDGPMTVDIAADAGVDTAGNGNTAAEQFSIDYDGTSPTVAISSTLEGPTNVSPIPVTITFSESVTGFDVTDLVLGNGTGSGFAGSGSEYTVNITPATDGPVTVDIAADTGVDTAGNGNTAAEQFSIDYDITSPTVMISSILESPTDVSPIPVTITFSESVTGFDVTDLVLENGSASDFAGSGSEYTVNITPATDGPVTVDIAADAGVDTAGNGNTAAEQFSIDYDITSPTVAISSTLEGPTNVSPIPVTITFSESVTGFDVTDLVLENGSASDFAGSGSEYTVNITPATDGPVTVDIAADAGVDTAGNGNTAAEQFSIDYDGTGPAATIMFDDTDLSAGETAIVTITFNEVVTGFDNDDLTVPNGTLTAVSSADGGITFTGTFTPTADFESATNVIALDNTGVTDASSNPGLGITESDNFTIDTIRPDVTISSSEESPTNTSPFSVTVIFSEDVTGFEESDVIVGNGSVSLFAGSGTTYIIIVTPLSDGQVTVDIAENVAVNMAGSGNTAATQFSIEYDGTSPDATITSSESSPTSSTLIPITITFDESVDGFDINDISVSNGSASFFGGSGSSYIAVITPLANGLVTVDIPEDSATDEAGNGNNAATQFTIIYEGSVVLQPKVFLQGPLLNPATPGLMNDILREDGHIPTISPYADGLIVDANVFNTGGTSGTGLTDDNIVDWVWVELRDELDNTVIVTGQSALVQRDGDVVSLDGLSDLSMLAAPSNYYVVINHRNHLSAMSSGIIALSETPVSLDFSDSAFTTFGTNSQVMLGSGDMALWAGDVNADELVRYLGPSNDTSAIKDSILGDPGNTTSNNFYPFTGYDNGDIDMNGQIKYLGPGNDSALLKDVILSYPDNTTSSNFFPVSGQTPN